MKSLIRNGPQAKLKGGMVWTRFLGCEEIAGSRKDFVSKKRSSRGFHKGNYPEEKERRLAGEGRGGRGVISRG